MRCNHVFRVRGKNFWGPLDLSNISVNNLVFATIKTQYIAQVPLYVWLKWKLVQEYTQLHKSIWFIESKTGHVWHVLRGTFAQVNSIESTLGHIWHVLRGKSPMESNLEIVQITYNMFSWKPYIFPLLLKHTFEHVDNGHHIQKL